MPKMGTTPCCSKVDLNRGSWSSDEDKLLIDYVQTHGEGQWRYLPSKAGLLRCGKSCRLRWMNYLRPGIKRGKFTSEEEDIIIKLHTLHGSRWSFMATKLSGRTDNEIKNHWNAHLQKRVKKASDHHSNTSKNKNVKKKKKTLDVPKARTTSDEKPKEVIILDSAFSSSISSLSTSRNESFENGMVSGGSSSCTFDLDDADFDLSWLSSEPYFEVEGTSIINGKQGDGLLMDGYWENMLKEDESLMLEKLYYEYQTMLNHQDISDNINDHLI